jgi:aspartate carbamoyltransferase
MHILSQSSFDENFVDNIFSNAAAFEAGNYDYVCNKKILTNVFLEPSTRTKHSFEVAMAKLGGNCLYIGSDSSIVKGESKEDTIKTVSAHSDVVVFRCQENFSAEQVAKVSLCPIINGGDGSNEHPTQNLTDLYFLRKKFGKNFNNLTFLFCGDLLFSRTVHGLASLIDRFHPDCKFIYASSQIAVHDNELVKRITPAKSQIVPESSASYYLSEADVVYLTRHQSERPGNKVALKFVLRKNVLSAIKKSAFIMHPMPRNGELDVDCDDDPRSGYFEQAKGGVFVRMAILKNILK